MSTATRDLYQEITDRIVAALDQGVAPWAPSHATTPLDLPRNGATGRPYAGLNVLLFQLTANRTVDRWDRSRVAPPIGRAVAVITLAIWIAAVFAGRMIGFTSTRQATPPPATEDINFEELLGLPGSSTSDSTAPVPKK